MTNSPLTPLPPLIRRPQNDKRLVGITGTALANPPGTLLVAGAPCTIRAVSAHEQDKVLIEVGGNTCWLALDQIRLDWEPGDDLSTFGDPA